MNLESIYLKSKVISIDKSSKIVIMSDCHRGDGNLEDNFSKNEVLFNGALKQYFKNGFTYIELGDGDELWEVDDIEKIISSHKSTYKLLDNFYKDDRLVMIFGNHDFEKSKSKKLYKKYLHNLNIYESLVLDYEGKKIFLLHGHQVSLLNTRFLKLTKFFVRHVWKYLERVGINDPTSAAVNNSIQNRTHNKLVKFSKNAGVLLISGHTHKPSLKDDVTYANTGSCVHPNGITALEIEYGHIMLVKWKMDASYEGDAKVVREVISDVSLNKLI